MGPFGLPAGGGFCSEGEWQRAARGADKRRYPTGNSLDPKLTNIDESYGRGGEATDFGPNQVSSFPAGASPFGVLAGNVMEIAVVGERYRALGGAWFFPSINAMVTSWQVLSPSQKSPWVGLRVCADYDGPLSEDRAWDEDERR